MFSKSLISLTAALVVATSAFASATTVVPLNGSFAQSNGDFAAPDVKNPEIRAGIVHADGTISQGRRFAVSHDGTGEYTLNVPARQFKNCPTIIVTPWGVNGHAPIANSFDYITCGNFGEVKIQIRIYSRTDGAGQDNGFMFVMNDT